MQGLKAMINKIYLKNFKCYLDQPFLLSELTLFCGNNSAGKSTAIQALLLIFQNNFSTKLELTGGFIQPGTYDDIHNRNAENDSLLINIETTFGSLSWGYNEKEFDSQTRQHVEEAPLPFIDELSPDVSRLMQRLKEHYAKEFIYLSAERWGPRSNYPYSTQRRSSKWLGVNGEFTPQVLEKLVKSSKVIGKDDPRQHSGRSVKSMTTAADNLYAWMGEISPGVFIDAQSLKGADIATNQYQFFGQSYRAVNVGFGLSYVLPVVLALLNAESGGLVIIENPEAHLHPKGQSILGRLIALTAEAGVQVIVETHSDHVINGMRIMPRLGKVNHKKMSIYQIGANSEHSDVRHIEVKSDGQLSEWPEDFFDQQLIDMDILISGKGR